MPGVVSLLRLAFFVAINPTLLLFFNQFRLKRVTTGGGSQLRLDVGIRNPFSKESLDERLRKLDAPRPRPKPPPPPPVKPPPKQAAKPAPNPKPAPKPKPAAKPKPVPKPSPAPKRQPEPTPRVLAGASLAPAKLFRGGMPKGPGLLLLPAALTLRGLSKPKPTPTLKLGPLTKAPIEPPRHWIGAALAAGALSRGLLLPIFNVLSEHPTSNLIAPLRAFACIALALVAQCGLGHEALVLVFVTSLLGALIALPAATFDLLAIARIFTVASSAALPLAFALISSSSSSGSRLASGFARLSAIDAFASSFGCVSGAALLRIDQLSALVRVRLLCLVSLLCAAAGAFVAREQRLPPVQSIFGGERAQLRKLRREQQEDTSPPVQGAKLRLLSILVLMLSSSALSTMPSALLERDFFSSTAAAAHVPYPMDVLPGYLLADGGLRLISQFVLVAPLSRMLGLSWTLISAYLVTVLAATGASSEAAPAFLVRPFALSASYVAEAAAAALVYAFSPGFEPIALCVLHAATIMAPALFGSAL